MSRWSRLWRRRWPRSLYMKTAATLLHFAVSTNQFIQFIYLYSAFHSARCFEAALQKMYISTLKFRVIFLEVQK